MVFAGIALLLGAWVLARGWLGYPRPTQPHGELAAREAAFVRAAADATFPAGGAIPLSGSEAGVVAYVDAYLAALPRRNRVLIRLLLAFFEHATLLFPAPGIDGWRRFTALRPEQQAEVLRAWGRSSLRLRRVVFQSLRTVLTMAYLGSPAVLRCLELAPLAIETPLVELDLLVPPIGHPRSSIRWQPRDLGVAAARGPLDPHGPLHPDYEEPAA